MAIQAHFLQDKNKEKFYPYAHADATFDRNGNKVGTILDNINTSISDMEESIIANVQVQSDWDVSDTSSKAFIKNKPTSLPASDVSDWAKASTKPTYAWSEIKDKPSKFVPSEHTHDNVTIDADGFMSNEDKVKLNSIENGANKTVVDSSLNSTSTNPVQNKIVNSALSGKVPTTRKINGKALTADISLSASDVGAITATQKGANGGVAELDSTGKVPAAQLPSYVDDVLEYDSQSEFPGTGESGKIYVAKDTNKSYRWSGSTYTEISASLALGETATTAYRGDRGKIAYEHSQKQHAPANAEPNVQSDWNESNTGSDAYIKNKPTSLPANGGNADTVNGHTVEANVPADAVFTDTKPVVMKGSTSSASGSAGYVPAPASGTNNKYLRGDGTWATPPNTTYSNMTGASTGSAGKSGLVPAPSAGAANRYLRSDGTWSVPPDTNTTYTLSSFGITATAAELNKLDGVTATATELNYVDGVTSNIQKQLNNKAFSSHNHTAASITDLEETVEELFPSIPSSLPNPQSLTISLNGTSQGAYNGSSAKSINITPSSIGAAATSHGTHVTYSTTAPSAPGTASAGSASTVSRGDHVHPLQTTISGNAGSATKLATARNINGMSFDGSANRTNYGTCSTAAATTAKTVSCTGFSLVTGAEITVKFTVTNTASNPTLNVNGTGAKAIYYRGTAISAGYLAANRTYTFRYNGTQYELVGDVNIDTNTTYTIGTSSVAGITKLYTGTGTNTDGAMTQAAITDALSNKAPSTHNHSASNITSGTLPTTRGGTGLTSTPIMLINLASTTATNVFAANPRPGVTGTLPIANGGTGATSAAAARTALGITAANIGAATSAHTHTAFTGATSEKTGSSGFVPAPDNPDSVLLGDGTWAEFATDEDIDSLF